MEHLRGHEMFEEMKVTEEDPCVKVMLNKTEEGQKVERSKGDKYYAAFEKKAF